MSLDPRPVGGEISSIGAVCQRGEQGFDQRLMRGKRPLALPLQLIAQRQQLIHLGHNPLLLG